MTDAAAETRSPHFGREATASTYRDIHLPRVFAPWAQVLLGLVPVQPGEAVLDVATGPGTVARVAAMRAGAGGRVVGVDISPAMLAIARAWGPEPGAAPIEYIQASASAMPIPDATFDVAYCQQGLQHMSDPMAALRQIRRTLKAGGRLGVAIWAQSPFGLFREVVAASGVTGDGGPQPSDFGRDPAALAAALRSLLADPRRRAELGRAGRRRARRLYDFDRIGAVTRDVYAEVVDRRRTVRSRRFARSAHGASRPSWGPV
jgi:SAM-dependent methyltransferase